MDLITFGMYLLFLKFCFFVVLLGHPWCEARHVVFSDFLKVGSLEHKAVAEPGW